MSFFLPPVFASLSLILAMAWHSGSHAKTDTQKTKALSEPCAVKADNWRGNAFYEILFMSRQANGSGIGNYYNSIGNTFDVPNEVVDARFKALSAETLKKEYGGDGVFFNGPRRFVANGVSGMAFDSCKKRVMGTIPFYVFGTFEVPSFSDFVSGSPVAYKVLTSRRTNTFSFKAGEQVHELITPEGAVYTMFSLSLKVDPNNTIENLPTLGKRLTLPKGWTYRMRKLDKDMVLSSSYDANPPNTIVLDQFEGNYQFNAGAKPSSISF